MRNAELDKAPDWGQIARACRDGEARAWEALVAATRSGLLASARRILRSSEEAEDVVQEGYLKAHRSIAGLRDPEALPGWLHQIVRSTALNRRRDRRPDTPIPVESLDSAAPAEADPFYEAAGRAAVAWAHLEDADRSLIEARYWAGLRGEQHADAVGASRAAARKRLQRARKRILDQSREVAVPPEPRIADLLLGPRLTVLPDHPVSRAWFRVQALWPDSVCVELPETLDREIALGALPEERLRIGDHLDTHAFQLPDRTLLRTELTLPLLERAHRQPDIRTFRTAGRAFRRVAPSRLLLEQFHLAELLMVDETLDIDRFVERTVARFSQLFPGRSSRVRAVEFPLYGRAIALALRVGAEWLDILECGQIRQPLHGKTAFGLGVGLERIAMLDTGVSDIRRMSRWDARSPACPGR